MDTLSLHSVVSTHSLHPSQVRGATITNIISALLLLLSTPIFIFGGFILIYFYHVQSFGIVSYWFHILPLVYFFCSASNIVSSVFVALFQTIPLGVFRSFWLAIMTIFLVVSCILNMISTYGCTQLTSDILQQQFLSVNIGDITEQYMLDPIFRGGWDNLQRQYFCCGTLLFNTGFQDWKNNFGKENNSVPDSCCHVESPQCGSNIFDGSLPPMKIYTNGCMTVIQSKMENEVTSLIMVFMVLSAVMVVISLASLILSLCTGSPMSGMNTGGYKAHRTVDELDHTLTDGSVHTKNRYSSVPGPKVDLYTTKMSSEV